MYLALNDLKRDGSGPNISIIMFLGRILDNRTIIEANISEMKIAVRTVVISTKKRSLRLTGKKISVFGIRHRNPTRIPKMLKKTGRRLKLLYLVTVMQLMKKKKRFKNTIIFQFKNNDFKMTYILPKE
jgi:hypothetical protein